MSASDIAPEQYVRNRRAEAWWARDQLIEAKDIVADLKSPSRRTSVIHERILEEIDGRLSEASEILEKIMKKETFQEGDEQLFSKAFDLMDISRTGRVGYDIFWQALAFVGDNIGDADKQDLFTKVQSIHCLVPNFSVTDRCSWAQVDQSCR